MWGGKASLASLRMRRCLGGGISRVGGRVQWMGMRMRMKLGDNEQEAMI
jgi:hypothetical protein